MVGNPDGEKPLVRSRHRWEDNIKWILKKQDGRCGLDSSGSGYRQVVGFCENGKKPVGSIKGGNFLTHSGTISFSRRTMLDGVS